MQNFIIPLLNILTIYNKRIGCSVDSHWNSLRFLYSRSFWKSKFPGYIIRVWWKWIKWGRVTSLFKLCVNQLNRSHRTKIKNIWNKWNKDFLTTYPHFVSNSFQSITVYIGNSFFQQRTSHHFVKNQLSSDNITVGSSLTGKALQFTNFV